GAEIAAVVGEDGHARDRDAVVERAEIGDRVLGAGDVHSLVDDAPLPVGDRIDAASRDRDAVVERAEIGDRVLGAGDAEGLVDGGAALIRDGVHAVSDRESVVERAGVVDRVLAARDAECLIDECSALVRNIVDAGTADDQPLVEGAAVDDRVLRIAADRDLAVDVAAGGGGDAVAAVAGDRDPTVEVAATRDDDRAVAGADEISVDRTVAGVVERLARPGHGFDLNGGPAAVDRSRVGESTAAGAVDYDARTAGARDLPVVVNPHGAGSIDAYHTLDNGPRVVVDLSAGIQHD